MKYIDELGKFKDMVLATSYQDKVTARSVSTILYEGKVYFQTANNKEKYFQLKNNSNVALTRGFCQVEGVARSIGSWSENIQICEAYKQVHLNSYNSYGTLDEEEVIEVTITRLKFWSYEDNDVYMIEYYPLTDNLTKIKQLKV